MIGNEFFDWNVEGFEKYYAWQGIASPAIVWSRGAVIADNIFRLTIGRPTLRGFDPIDSGPITVDLDYWASDISGIESRRTGSGPASWCTGRRRQRLLCSSSATSYSAPTPWRSICPISGLRRHRRRFGATGSATRTWTIFQTPRSSASLHRAERTHRLLLQRRGRELLGSLPASRHRNPGCDGARYTSSEHDLRDRRRRRAEGRGRRGASGVSRQQSRPRLEARAPRARPVPGGASAEPVR